MTCWNLDKGSYYNQSQLHEQLLNEEYEESSDTDSSIDFGNQSVSFKKLNSSSISREENEKEERDSDLDMNIELTTESRQFHNEESDSHDDDETISEIHGRLIMHLKSLQESVSSAAVCRKCHVGSLKLENLPGQRALCSRLQWNCNNCNHKCEFLFVFQYWIWIWSF
ncbi:unnamed protein product [Mytilus coruscus]|uniref:Uncharacterized protein n=1 Tax=Mytilus coruscus TaxID=42192 RepID=A0A6J8ALR4_MYTCO|nr:unnamed protein product [Mytilus coruscus]